MYIAWLCYPHAYEDDDVEPEICFEQPPSWEYARTIMISFTVLNSWGDADKRLYTQN